jgi:phage terminase Nu1 subunit (DNA packaging protein)
MGLKFNKATFAQLIGKSPRWVTKLITEEGMPVESGGGKGVELVIDSEEAINWLIREALAKELGMREGDDTPASGSKSEEELLLTKAKRIQEEIKAKKAQGLSIDLEDLKPVLFEVANIFGQQADALGGRIASEFASINDPAIIKARMLEESRRIRAQTAERLINFIAGYRGYVSGDSDSATTEGS